jgi:hypothetical protein
MGLLYKCLGICPTNYDEFEQSIERRSIRPDVTIRVGVETDTTVEFLPQHRLYVEFSGGGTRFKEYGRSRTDFNRSVSQPKATVSEEHEAVNYALKQRDRLIEMGFKCHTFVRDKPGNGEFRELEGEVEVEWREAIATSAA